MTLMDSCWEVEEKFEVPDVRLACLVLKSKNLSLITFNVYAPNDHDVRFFEMVFERLLYFKDKYPLQEERRMRLKARQSTQLVRTEPKNSGWLTVLDEDSRGHLAGLVCLWYS
jgi:hypothetical protein